MSLAEDMEAFDRAFGEPEQGKPLVSDEKKKEMLIDDESAFERAFETDAVDVHNSNVETEELSLWNRFFSEPYKRGIERQAQTFQRLGQSQQAETMAGIAAAMSDPAVLEEQYRQSTNLPSVLLQTITTPLRMVFDSGSEMVMFGAEKGVGMLPEGLKEGAAEQFQALMQTKGGQMAWAAAGEGMEAWEKFKESYPNEAANLVAVMDLGFTRGTGPLIKQPTKFMKLERVGMRNEVKPLAGGDADVYKILFEGKKKTPEQVRLTEDPKGILGIQEQLASADQLELIDMAKSAGVSGNKTLQTNHNAFQDYYDKLEDSLMKMLAKNEKKINWAQLDDNLRANLKAQFDEMQQGPNSKLMSNNTARAEVAQLYQMALSIIDEQGGTLQGFRVSRSMFDSMADKMGYDVSGDSLTTKNLAAMAVRKAVNQTVFDVVPEAETIFTKMSKIIPTLGDLNVKAATEAKTRFGRFIAELGLNEYAGNSALSKVHNAIWVLGGTAVVGPYAYIKNKLRSPGPAKIRAKIAYVKRDMFDEIRKAIKATKDPVKRNMLQRDSKEIYAYLNAVFKQVESELEQEENYDSSMYRIDGSKKSAQGFLGPVKNLETGKTMTELSINVPIDGKEVQIPTMVPTLTAEEIKILQSQNWEGKAKDLPRSIVRKAVDHARKRMDAGLNPFYQDGE